MAINHTPVEANEIRIWLNTIDLMSMFTIFMLWKVKSMQNMLNDLLLVIILLISRISSKYLLYRQLSPTSRFHSTTSTEYHEKKKSKM